MKSFGIAHSGSRGDRDDCARRDYQIGGGAVLAKRVDLCDRAEQPAWVDVRPERALRGRGWPWRLRHYVAQRLYAGPVPGWSLQRRLHGTDLADRLERSAHDRLDGLPSSQDGCSVRVAFTQPRRAAIRQGRP